MDDQATRVVGRRVGAFLIDGLIVGAVNLALLIGFSAAAGTAETSGSSFNFSVDGVAGLLYFLVAFGVAIGYFVVWQGRSGATVGKRALGIRLVGEDGLPPGAAKALARWLLFVVDGFPYFLPYGLGFVVALSSRRNQRVGDMAASTLVVSRPGPQL